MKGSLCDGTTLYMYLDKSNENVCTMWRDREELWPKCSLVWGAAEMQAAETLPKCKHKPSAMHWVPMGSASQLLVLVGSTLWKDKGDKDTRGLCHHLPEEAGLLLLGMKRGAYLILWLCLLEEEEGRLVWNNKRITYSQP